MEQHVFFMLVGLGLGGLYALIGVGLVLHYRGTGVIHFSLAALASYSVFVVDELRDTGDLVFPIVFIPDRIHIGDDVGTWPAVGIALALAIVLGLVVDLLVFRRLRGQSTLAKVVASIGLLVGFQRLIELKFGFEVRSSERIIPAEPLKIMEGVTVPRDRLWFVLIVVAIAIGLAALLRFTRTGLAIRAAAENPQSASFARWSPVRLSTITIVGVQFIVAFGFVFGAPVKGSLSAVDFTFMIVPGLTAALVGRLRSLTVTVAAGLAIGMLGSEMVLLSSKPWFPDWAKSGAEDALVFAVIAGALFLLGKGLPSRGDEGSAALPPVLLPKNRPSVIAVCSALLLVAIVFTSGSWRFGIITSLAFALIAASLVVLVGFVGQLSLAQAGFAGTAGFFLTKLGDGWPYPVTLLVAALGSAALGVFVGVPALRIRGAQLAVVTIGAALALQSLIFDNNKLTDSFGDFVPTPSIFGIDLSVRSGRDFARLPFAIAVAVTVVIVLVLLGNVLRGRTGRRFLAVRSNERAAASIGLSVANTKLTAFALSSLLAGLGGGLITYSRGQISAESFGVLAGLGILVFSFVGGITSVAGAVLAAGLAPLGINFVAGEKLLDLGEYWVLIGGFGAVLQTIIAPGGIAGNVAGRLKRRRAALDTGPGAEVVLESRAVDDVERSPVDTGGEVRLEVRDITVRFGGLIAVNEVGLEARSGEILGLIGPNGAGKTTLVDAVTGFVPMEGEVFLDGSPIHDITPHQITRRGLARTWQSMELFEDMDVRSNLLVAGERASWREMFVDLIAPSSATTDADDTLRRLGLDGAVTRSPSELSLGQRKLVGIARALMTQPRVLLLDEPAAGLDSAESRELGRRLRAISDSGVAVVLIDHDMSLILEICDRLAVIDTGHRIAYGSPQEVRSDPAVIEAYLGRSESTEPEDPPDTDTAAGRST